MPNSDAEIVRCPAELLDEAISLVLCELAPSQRRLVAGELLTAVSDERLASEPLFIARRENRVAAAAWGQRQAGNIAIFWPPQVAVGEDEAAMALLAEVVVRELDLAAIDLAQSILSSPAAETVEILRHVDFRQVAELLYLSCEAERFPLAAPEPCEVEFVEYDETQRERLTQLVERTYEGTLDCAELNGVRGIDDVISGYEATGAFRPENWLFVRADGRDAGVLLLADHPHAKHWELMYMGLAPEFRGRGWGRQIARYAQWLARGARVDRLLVAVDAANEPAAKSYRSTGFEIWERRSVFLRFLQKVAH